MYFVRNTNTWTVVIKYQMLFGMTEDNILTKHVYKIHFTSKIKSNQQWSVLNQDFPNRKRNNNLKSMQCILLSFFCACSFSKKKKKLVDQRRENKNWRKKFVAYLRYYTRLFKKVIFFSVFVTYMIYTAIASNYKKTCMYMC